MIARREVGTTGRSTRSIAAVEISREKARDFVGMERYTIMFFLPYAITVMSS